MGIKGFFSKARRAERRFARERYNIAKRRMKENKATRDNEIRNRREAETLARLRKKRIAAEARAERHTAMESERTRISKAKSKSQGRIGKALAAAAGYASRIEMVNPSAPRKASPRRETKKRKTKKTTRRKPAKRREAANPFDFSQIKF